MGGTRVLILGAGGMLGCVTARYLRERGYEVMGITKTKRGPGLYQLDATEEEPLFRFLEENRFDAVINCAALLVAASEADPCGAVRLNAWLPHFLAAYCRQRGMYLLQVSTDGVFSGEQGSYDEGMPSDAPSFYGKSKYLGEVYDGALTVRSAFWGADVNRNGQGIFHWFMGQEGPVTGYTAALFNGVSNLEFAKFAHAALQNRWTGLYHLCAADSLSKFDFLCLQGKVFGRDTEIRPSARVRVDRTLRNTRTDIAYPQASFARMMTELRDWLRGEPDFSGYFRP